MSFKVLVIPEDPTHNGYILKPLVECIFVDLGKPNAKVTVLTNPRLQGYNQAVQAIKGDLSDRYGFWDLWLFIPDADRASPDAMEHLENDLKEKSVRLICCPAQPEVEIYACVAFRDELKAGWQEARKSKHMKEEYFEPLLKMHGDPRRAGGGRDLMINESLSNLKLLYRLCPELEKLKQRIKRII